MQWEQSGGHTVSPTYSPLSLCKQLSTVNQTERRSLLRKEPILGIHHTEYIMGATELFSQLNAFHLSRDKRCLWQQTDLLKCYNSYVLYRTTATYCTSVIFTVYRNVQRPFDHRLVSSPPPSFLYTFWCKMYSVQHSQSLFQKMCYNI